MRVNYNYLHQQFADVEDYYKELRELVKSGEFTLGPWVEAFEKDFAKYVGVKHAIGTNNGTEALTLSVKALGIGPGDEVITVANTFYATVGAIVAAGAKPVFVDSDDRFLIDVNQVEDAITSRTKAVIPVHWAGCPADMKAIKDIARRKNIKVIEDACPAMGGKIDNQHVGSMGDIAGFSMHPLKPLNVWGDGGVITTNSDEMARWLRLYRNHGMVDRDHIEFWGINNRLQPIQAMVGRRLLPQVEAMTAARIKVAQRLDAGLRKLEGSVYVPPRPSNMREVYQLYLITVKNRDKLHKHLNEKGIEAKIHYPLPLHFQKAAQSLGYKKGDFPKAEKQAQEILTLPGHQHITMEQVDYMLDEIRKFYS